jgi:ferredoxin-NADP reductase
VDIRLTAEDGYQAQRSYSIATPEEDTRVTITVELVDDGEVSPFLVGELRLGDRLELRGPIGGYFVWEPARGGPLQLIGGGSGVVPLMAMVRARVAGESRADVAYLSSSRAREDILYREELGALVDSDPSVKVVHTLTRSHPDGWAGPTRRVDRPMLEEVLGEPVADAWTFVCGPTGFVEAVATHLVDMGYEPARVRTERFGPSGG